MLIYFVIYKSLTRPFKSELKKMSIYFLFYLLGLKINITLTNTLWCWIPLKIKIRNVIAVKKFKKGRIWNKESAWSTGIWQNQVNITALLNKPFPN